MQSGTDFAHSGFASLLMIGVGLLLLYLAIKKEFEPLLMLPIGFGAILANIPMASETMIGAVSTIQPSLADDALLGSTQAIGQAVNHFISPGGFIGQFYEFGIERGLFPLLIFMGVGAMTDFGPLIANPKTLLLGAAAQFGIFAALFLALVLNIIPGIEYTLSDAASIGIIGGADGPTSIYVTSRLSRDLLGPIAVAAYSYMALVPVIQPPIMRLLTSKQERAIVMHQQREVSQREKILFPIVVFLLTILLLPTATPLIGALMFGNLTSVVGATKRLSQTMQNELINIVTIMLGLAVGSKMSADKFLTPQTLGIIALGLVAFAIGTASGVILAKLMSKWSKTPINPLIGAAGVSAVPMSARVVNKVGLEENESNYLLMHAMGPNVAGVLGSAVVAGILLKVVPLLENLL
ncbi:sodium ion-translocating decarboxylase subunit beta [Entomospira culicis]|uniref:Sodium ion-translocating decarboxylase subunit beta n=2 Tax=Entomospira culicis TaxID=2719989 RepID=A0A968GF63_9SPIO|nr:sodium ion-translocating decarboxylase subunit beta [Entomospira culicis]NIZ19200.1 sodium ion-translocating decarboxylase subunit beta [Entomospira culicis]NIZ69414.1 sodium ion-translocating decarboxylase subunit beta [Entomospira culicis]WDI37965.1 sodium ion-translocating decarboxylase subunit beta [Entomospira culicis]WDI39589.1 sodium ion-translocating decarboxylase subunit beta [Entomospira culicis]